VSRNLREAAADAGVVVLMLVLLLPAALAGWTVGHYTVSPGAKTVTVGSTTPGSGTTTTSGTSAAGKAIFESAGCGGCHTLAAAGATGTAGTNLDLAKPSLPVVVQRVTDGGAVMSGYKSRLTPQQIREVAAFVVASAGGSG
jgi:mono/diheme cytochrome c family protein